ncbi:MAG: MBL fold metallo-hydrolase [Kiritimatiellae bacterium]|nr:MBL fold metallo-hydrolase [Kiritimatiellia bacterium]MDD4341965.1 MBL fold metallo-hydrolase [Kiritimatiellia bacterium]
MKWHFLGGASQVTGSKHILETGETSLLFDCGLFQGRRKEANEINRNLGFAPGSIDAMVLSHAHIDHCGNIPTLAQQGYRNPIHTTTATADLLPIMLLDSAHIHESDAAYLNQKTNRRGLPPIIPLYTKEDADAAIRLIQPHKYLEPVALPGGVSFVQMDAGHILGSAVTRIEIPRPGTTPLRVGLAFDLGRYNLPLLNDPVQMKDVDILICESTYGNRHHEDALNEGEDLREAITRTLGRGGKVIIPTFALGRAQEIIYLIAQLRQRGEIPEVPVYLDSPMAQAVSRVFGKNKSYLDEDFHALYKLMGPIMSAKWLIFTESVAESKAITSSSKPSIVLAASGMCEHGRILHHLKHGIENELNSVLLVGYQAAHTLGRRLHNGDKTVRIFGDEFTVRAEVESLRSFSAHADRTDLLRYVREAAPRHVFLVHGEQDQRESLGDLLRHELNIDVHLPANGDVVNFEKLLIP